MDSTGSVSGRITITRAGADDADQQTDKRDKKVIFKKLCIIYYKHKQNKQYTKRWCSRKWCTNVNA